MNSNVSPLSVSSTGHTHAQRIAATGKSMLCLALLGAIAAAGAPQNAHSAPTQPPIVWGACPPPPDGVPDAGQQCALITVPLDYQNPNGQTISVAVSRITAANPSLRRGVLLLNPGGPGGSGLDLPRLFSTALPQSVLDRYDLIGFDPRFIGRSTPLTCNLTEQQSDQAFPMLTQSGGFPATVQFAQLIANDCAHAASGMLPFITTVNTARDMEQIRQGLGEDKISYLGYSYGTYLGAVYASLFPQRTDRFILDSSVDPQWVWRTQFRGWGQGGKLRFPDFANFAAANNSTYQLGSTPDQINQLFFDLRSKLAQNPVPLPSEFSDGTLVNGPVFTAITFGNMYFESDLPNLAWDWQQLKASTGSASEASPAMAKPAAASFPAVPVDNAVVAGLAVVCDDVSWPTSVGEYQRDLNADSKQFPMFGALGSNIQACAFWPNQAVEPLVPISSVGPSNILMLQNLRDLATLYTGALEMHSELGQRSRLVSVDAGGHAIYIFNPNTCANDAATAYLANGTFPASDVSCPANAAANVAAPSSPAREAAIREMRRRKIPSL
jgi:pimeloyl-ACP methyl ester carboxylesterase